MSVVAGEIASVPKHSNMVTRLSRSPVFYIFLLVAACKLGFYIADPYPSFQFGDSGAYLATALIKYIPPDRSFTYGFLLRPLVLHSHSFRPVLLLQILASGAASVLLGTFLLRYFRAKPALAVASAVISAIEPLQLMAERFIMSEAVATFGFALYLSLAASFLKSRRILPLIAAQIAGVLLVTLRYSFLPLVLILSVALPILAAYTTGRINWRAFLIRLVCAVAVSQMLFAGYRHLYGFLAHTKPAYLSRDGDFLLADMAPIITTGDFPIPAERVRFLQRLRIPLNDLRNRRLHRWVDGGLCQVVLEIANGDEELANKLARKTALRAMTRDPAGVLRLAFSTYKQFFSHKYLVWALQLNEGHFVGPTANDVKMIRDWFGVDAMDRKYESVTKKWQGSSALWCGLMVGLPWLYLIEMLWHRKQVSAVDWLLLFCAYSLLGCAIGPVDVAYPRYLMPLPWLSVLIIGVMVARLIRSTGDIPAR